MNKLRAAFTIGMGLATLGVIAAGWRMVAPGEVMVVRRLGRPIRPPWGPGLHWTFPLGIDRVEHVRSDAVRQLIIGQSGPPSALAEPWAGEALSGDLNVVRIQATVQFRVSSAVDFVLSAEQVDPALARFAEASLSRAVARRGVDAVLRTDRRQIGQEAERALQSASDRLSLGVAILSVSVIDARPPVEVAGDFAAAQSAESQRDRRINEARTYEAVQAATAASQGEARLQAARAESARVILSSRAEAQRFIALLTEARRSPVLTVRRFYIESMHALLGRVKRKLILPPGESVDVTVLGLRGNVEPVPVPVPARASASQAKHRQEEP
jgi:membrane protease subunit HflK